MKTISSQARVTSFLLAALTTALVLGSTVQGMQPGGQSDLSMVVLETVTIRPSTVN